ncbi:MULTISPECIES: GyrI-like domain-containing protein [Yersinia]|uniref:Bacterial transcription activator, effector binding domain n=1 Tax=Yersinia intermedia TaxID=631 RepID=A0A0H5LSR4_YERIN|nr:MULTISPECIES: GyrI-like domain-containing protein [Yersinia]CRY54169.1 Bacterial transcription activator%2C effector binding domain [Yersinia intermedia]
MKPKSEYIKCFCVAGLCVRTKNINEFNSKSARIPGLWTQFYSEGVAERITTRLPDSPIFGVYSAYESDATGFYDLTIGVSVDKPNSDFENIAIEAGEYLVFEAKGVMPDAIIHTWSNIWSYFEKHPKISRSFLTDFEAYKSPEEAHIYIGISTT